MQEPFGQCALLTELFLRNNRIACVEELYHLRDLKFLHTLWLCDNPIAELPDYRALVFSALPQVAPRPELKTPAHSCPAFLESRIAVS